MSDIEILVAVMVAFWAHDCVRRVSRNGGMLVRNRAGHWRVYLAGSLFGNREAGWHGVFWPGSAAYGFSVPPLSVSPEGVLAYVGHEWTGMGKPTTSMRALVAGSQVTVTTDDDGRILVNGEVFLKPVPQHRRDVLELLKQMAQAEPGSEAAQGIAARWHARMTNPRAARWVMRRMERAARRLRRSAMIMGLILLFWAPLCIRFLGENLGFLAVVAVAVPYGITMAVRAVLSMVRLKVGGWLQRTEVAVRTSICPPLALRTADALTLAAMPPLHPLAVAVAAARANRAGNGEEEQRPLRELAQGIVRDAHAPRLGDAPWNLGGSEGVDGEWARRVEEYHRLAVMKRVEELLEENGVRVEELLSAPAPHAPESQSWCPRCHAQFAAPQGQQCRDCGTATVAFR